MPIQVNAVFLSRGFVYSRRLSDNPLQTSVLDLFATLKYRFPNLVVGSITRESVRKALLNGITADQVCS